VIRRSRSAHNTGDDKIRFKAILEVLMSPVFWLMTGMNCGIHLTTGSLANFLPPILDGLGYEDEQAQLMSAIVYACAFVQTMIVARIADKTQHRGLLIIANTGLSLVGFGMLLGLEQPASRFAGTCILTAALYPCLMLVLVWLAMNMPGYSYRTSAIAMSNICAQLFAIIGNKIYVDPPYYREGLAVSAGMAAFAGTLAVVCLLWLRFQNRKKEAEKDSAASKELVHLTVDDISWKHPEFRHTY
jgi:MFS family permease